MKPFAELLDRLIYTPSRNAKIALLVSYFRAAPDPDRGWALAALTGGLEFKGVKAGAVRELAMRRVDPVLFEIAGLKGIGLVFRGAQAVPAAVGQLHAMHQFVQPQQWHL